MLRHLQVYERYNLINEDSRLGVPTWADVFEMLKYGELKRIDFSQNDIGNLKIQLTQRLRTFYQPICRPEDIKDNYVICPITLNFKKRVIVIFDINEPSKMRAIMGDPTGDINPKNVKTFGSLLIFPAVNFETIEDVCFYDRETGQYVIMEEKNKTLTKDDWAMINSLDLISRFRFGKWKINISSGDINIIDSEKGKRFYWMVDFSF